MWSKLSHPNILECYGVSVDAAPNCNLSVVSDYCLPLKVQLVQVLQISPWQENGNVASYIAKHPDAPRLRLVSGLAFRETQYLTWHRKMKGAAAGLEYLHLNRIVHGNGSYKTLMTVCEQG